MIDEEPKALVAENSLAIQEIRAGRLERERRWQESHDESERLWQEILASRLESDRLITSFNRQPGQLGNKLGDSTESLLRPSLDQALREQFEMTVAVSPQRIRYYGESFEFDMDARLRAPRFGLTAGRIELAPRPDVG